MSAITRRELLHVAGGLGILSCTGCGSGGGSTAHGPMLADVAPKTLESVGDTLIVIGTLTFKLPHPIAKVLGITLVTAGGALRMKATTLAKATETYKQKLTAAEVEQVSQVILQGGHATVEYTDKRKETVPITKDDAA